ncbi:HRDC domain-containing protein [Chengkuizengella sp. SCS-71B]|uniref:HRDC domain-containing protein n=1 Tax=Chengkuizengella sp. SCS-71B TaxID=3115290 RepID=UPI0032C21754
MIENLFYMNTLKKESQEKNESSLAQVYLFQLNSSWQMNWKVISDGEMVRDLKIEDKRLEDILLKLRFEFKQYIGEGYFPMYGDHFNHSTSLSPKNKRTQLLYFYSEQVTNHELFDLLRGWRREESDKLEKPPYIIASNRVLKMLSTFIPKTKEELLQIPGFATAKVEQFGDSILNITNQFERLTTFPLTWVEEEINVRKFDDWFYKKQMMK